MLPSVASTSLAVCLPRLGGTASGVFVGVSNVAIRSAIGVARCARGHTSIRLAVVVGVWHLQIGEHDERTKARRAFELGRCIALGSA